MAEFGKPFMAIGAAIGLIYGMDTVIDIQQDKLSNDNRPHAEEAIATYSDKLAEFEAAKQEFMDLNFSLTQNNLTPPEERMAEHQRITAQDKARDTIDNYFDMLAVDNRINEAQYKEVLQAGYEASNGAVIGFNEYRNLKKSAEFREECMADVDITKIDSAKFGEAINECSIDRNGDAFIGGFMGTLWFTLIFALIGQTAGDTTSALSDAYARRRRQKQNQKKFQN